MAERRMFAKSIVDSDAFLDMPLSAQALYFHLSIRADDEGFVGNPKRIRSMIGASEDDLKLLIAKRFLLAFPSGVVVIKHWRIHNYLQNDRCKPTTYIEERETLALDGKKAYTEKPEKGVYTKCIQGVSKLDTQERLGKDSLDVSMYESKERKNEDIHTNAGACAHVRKSYEQVMSECMISEAVRPTVWEFIKHCQLNGRTLTNEKLSGIFVEMDLRGYDDKARIDALNAAINGGYYDIRRD